MTNLGVPWLKVGYISPHPLIDTLPYEFYQMAPRGVMMMAACIEIGDYTLDAVESQLDIVETRVESLVRRGAARIIISGVPIAIALGRSRTQTLLAELKGRWGLPCDTDLEAIIAGVKAVGAQRVGLATRWSAHMNQGLASYLADAGITVVATANVARTMAENAGLEDKHGIRLATELGERALMDASQPDAIILPGGRWFTLDAVKALEAAHQRPVITNYAAGLWGALRDAGYREPVLGCGTLLAQIGEGT